MEINRIGSQPSGKGPADWFTGTVRIDPLFQAPDPALVAGASVTFEPGARTAWHTHPLGQTLIVTAGCGWVQREGGAIEEIHPGDVVWFAPGEKHWHGATPATAMTHIAIQERLDGKVVDWMEHVSDEQLPVLQAIGLQKTRVHAKDAKMRSRLFFACPDGIPKHPTIGQCSTLHLAGYLSPGRLRARNAPLLAPAHRSAAPARRPLCGTATVISRLPSFRIGETR
ncbi:MAG: (R)-mandelonitrile lyase [Bryobacteraceae bacterium]